MAKLFAYIVIFFVSNVVITNSQVDLGTIFNIASFLEPIVKELSGDAVAIGIQNLFKKEDVNYANKLYLSTGRDVKLPDGQIKPGKVGSAGGYDDGGYFDSGWDTGGVVRYRVKYDDKTYCIDIMFSMDAVDGKSGHGIAIGTGVCNKDIQKQWNAFADALKKGFTAPLGDDIQWKVEKQEETNGIVVNSKDDKISILAQLSSGNKAKLEIWIGPKGWNGECDMQMIDTPCNNTANNNTANGCPDCMHCCQGKSCQLQPAPKESAHMVAAPKDINGITANPSTKYPNLFGYILLVGVVFFILINNCFIGYWCVCKRGGKNEEYAKCDMITVNDE